MRTISILVALPALVSLIFPQSVLAKEIEDANTKIEFELTDNSKYISQEPVENPVPYYYEGYVPAVDLNELDRDIKLAKRKKPTSTSVPRGTMTINASAYTAAADECGKSDGITASGLKVKEKRTLACPPQYPFGTKVKIDGMGTYTCEDRGGAIKGNKFDIYVETKAEAFQFGRRHLTAEVI